MKKLLILLFLGLVTSAFGQNKTQKPDLKNGPAWTIYNRLMPEWKDTTVLQKTETDGMMVFNNLEMGNGIIEIDLKGENVLQQSFLGIAFNIQDDKTYEHIYFRPFNFMNPDTVRRSRAVQYGNLPNQPWFKLRDDFPGKYENKVKPVPDPNGWFHAKIVIDKPMIKVFVNNNPEPCLAVESLAANSKGKIGLWTGPLTRGTFTNLTVTPTDNKFGNNPLIGNYFNVGDAKLYYEVYGKGKPIVMLHGGVYGYIDEYENFIEELSKNYQVICLGTRGHGKSEIGKEPYTWDQRAEDAYKVIKSLTQEKVKVIGFSDGAASAFKLAANHPELVEKLVAIGFGDTPKGSRKNAFNYTADDLLKNNKEFFESRLAMMPEPKRFNEHLSKLNHLYNDDFLSTETFEKIQCPTLVMGGDKDEYHTPQNMVNATKAIKNGQLSIIPGCGHVVFYCNWEAVKTSILPFLNAK
ncbi:MAG TPA: alpha/beta hydrolase [Emticicia sp.]